MRNIWILGFLLNLLGCVHAIGMRNDEKCAREEMILEGLDINSGSSVTFGSNWQSFETTSSSSSVKCAKPKTPQDLCMIEAFKDSFRPSASFNRQLDWKNFLIVIGYCVYLLPGIAAYIYFDSDRDSALFRSKDIREESLKACELPTKSLPQAP